VLRHQSVGHPPARSHGTGHLRGALADIEKAKAQCALEFCVTDTQCRNPRMAKSLSLNLSGHPATSLI
jgi:hypothetical protein